jgi:hypothetical protein
MSKTSLGAQGADLIDTTAHAATAAMSGAVARVMVPRADGSQLGRLSCFTRRVRTGGPGGAPQ